LRARHSEIAMDSVEYRACAPSGSGKDETGKQGELAETCHWISMDYAPACGALNDKEEHKISSLVARFASAF
jgi:hypothetical protein